MANTGSSPTSQIKTIMMALSGVAGSQGALARQVKMSPATLNRRIQSPETVTVGELCRIMHYAGKVGLDLEFTVN